MMMMKNKKTSSSLLERDDDCVLFSSLGSLCRQKLASFQDKLSCPICKEFFTLPVTLVRCGHTFCGKCLNDYVRTFQDDKKRKCPRCKGPVTHESDWDNTGEVAVKPNELVEEIVESWKKVLKENTTSGGGGEEIEEGMAKKKKKKKKKKKFIIIIIIIIIIVIGYQIHSPLPNTTLPGSKQAEKQGNGRVTRRPREEIRVQRKDVTDATYDQLKESTDLEQVQYRAEVISKPDMESVVKNMNQSKHIREEAKARK